ncbi:MFS transporter [Streptomyces sp. NPDC048496]|uniref:MFS transporter n=1 Tax=Streptomyces sp. NPDC048496 TaxID=3365558 RepID=UPI003721A61A
MAAFPVGSCHVVGMAASLSSIPHLLPPHRLLEAIAKLASANTLADIGGPALAGALIGLIGAARTVAADGVSYLVTAWCTLHIRTSEPAPRPRTAAPSLRSEIRAGLAYTWRHPAISPLVTTNAITSTVLAGTAAHVGRAAAQACPRSARSRTSASSRRTSFPCAPEPITNCR